MGTKNSKIDYAHPKYARGYRKHHVLALVVSSAVLIFAVYALLRSVPSTSVIFGQKVVDQLAPSKLDAVQSVRGFSFNLPVNAYTVLATDDIAKPQLIAAPPYATNYQAVTLRPNMQHDSQTKLSSLSVETLPSTSYRQLEKRIGETEAIKQLGAVQTTDIASTVGAPQKVKLNGQDLWMVVTTTTPKENETQVMFVRWLKIDEQTIYQITAQNVIDQAATERTFAVPLHTIRLGAQVQPGAEKLSASLWGAGDATSSEATADELSPSVVKIYHFVCGDIVLKTQVLLKNTCDGTAGSGFFINNSGDIATNGHVVTISSVDLLMNSLASSPNGVEQVLKHLGYSDQSIQSAKPETLALILTAKLYALPNDVLRIQNKRELTVVALGTESLSIPDEAAASKLLDTFQENDRLKRAQIKAIDYAAKDIVQVNQQNGPGFSAGDAAIIAIRQSATPYIAFADTKQTDVNSKVLLIGFPTDAENQLTDNQSLSPTVTSGTISARRIASGQGGVLFQSDVDASKGNSGGPALNNHGQAIGLLTYRYKDDTTANAAKSYIRDIQGIARLARQNRISVGGDNKTQDMWLKGLVQYKKEHYKTAIYDFAGVQARFPAHRLVQDYAFRAQQSIHEGKDKSTDDTTRRFLSVVAILSLVAVAVAAYAVHRHHLKHHLHKQYHQLKKT